MRKLFLASYNVDGKRHTSLVAVDTKEKQSLGEQLDKVYALLLKHCDRVFPGSEKTELEIHHTIDEAFEEQAGLIGSNALDNSPTLEDVTRPVIKWLNDNMHPHAQVIVGTTGAELVEGVEAVNTMDFVKD